MWTRKGGVPGGVPVASDATRTVRVTSLDGATIEVQVPSDAKVSALANAVCEGSGTSVNRLCLFDLHQDTPMPMSIYQPIGEASDFSYIIKERTVVDVLVDLKESSGFLKAHPKWMKLTPLTDAENVSMMDLNVDIVEEQGREPQPKYTSLNMACLGKYTIDRKEKDNNFITGLRVRDLTRKTLPDLSPLVHLQILNCGKTFVQKLPDLSTLVNLEKLNCSNNKLTQLPDLSKLICLKMLLCSSNELTALPDLSKLVHLTTLYCANNHLTALPDLSTLTELDLLNCANNHLSVGVKTELLSHPACQHYISYL